MTTPSSNIQRVQQALALLPLGDLPPGWTRTGLLYVRTTYGAPHVDPLVGADNATDVQSESPPEDPGDGSAQLAIDAFVHDERSTPLFAYRTGAPPDFVDVMFTRSPERGGSQAVNREIAMTLVPHHYFPQRPISGGPPDTIPSQWSACQGVTLFENERTRIDLRRELGTPWTSYLPAAIALIAMSPSGRTCPPANYTIALTTAFPPAS
jgi:hypothetical protein